ncbi:MAG: P-loop NTPase fold protein [Vampirovibrionales bacterium]
MPDTPLALRSDKALLTKTDDQLERADFYESIANCFRQAPNGEPFAVGLTGEWGTGKSSAIQIITESLTTKYVVFKFSPWLYDTNKELTSFFLNDLGKVQPSLLRDLQHYNDKLQYANASFSWVSLLKNGWFASFACIISMCTALKLTLWIPWFTGLCVLLYFYEAFWKENDKKKQSLSQLREDIDKKTKKLTTPILVVIDDLDRLDNNAIQQVFRLIGSVCHFPNIHFLVAFDRKRVAQALNTCYSDGGDAYLEKIFQVIQPLPPVTGLGLFGIFKGFFPELFSKEKHYGAFEVAGASATDEEQTFFLERGERFIPSYQTIFTSKVKTIRGVKQLANNFLLTHALFGDTIFWLDLLFLETMKLYDPEFWNYVVSKRGLNDLGSTNNILQKHPNSQVYLEYMEKLGASLVKNEGQRVSLYFGDVPDTKPAFRKATKSLLNSELWQQYVSRSSSPSVKQEIASSP